MLQIANGVDEAASEKLNEIAMEFALSSAKLAYIHLNSLLETENIRVYGVVVFFGVTMSRHLALLYQFLLLDHI